MGHMRTFGTKVLILNKNSTKGKFDPRSKEGIFIGYPEHAKGYRVWVPNERKVVVSRDLRFMDERDHRRKTSTDEETIRTEATPNEQPATTEIGPNEPSFIQLATRRGRGRPRIMRLGSRGCPRKEYNCNQGQSDSDSSSTSNTSDRGRKRPPSTPLHLERKRTRISAQTEGEDKEDGVEDLENHEESDDNVFTDTEAAAGNNDEAVVDTEAVDDTNELRANCIEWAMNAVELSVSDTFKGRQSEEWKEVVKSEIESHVRYHTWEITDRLRDRNVIGSKTVLKNKLKPDGSLERREARIVARGFAQRPGSDYFDTFAPVARLDSVRTLTALAVENQLHISQLDITTAYLNGSINKEIFMEVPEGLEQGLETIREDINTQNEVRKRAARMLIKLRKGNQVCKLKKAIYGLKQAGDSGTTNSTAS